MNIKVGIVGLGTISKTHLNTLKSIKDVELVAVCDVDKQKVKDAQKEFGGEPYFDFNEMLKEQALDAILICVPQKVRYEPIESAVRKGLAIFCEKPPAFDMETARKVERVIKKSKVINSVGFMYRYSKITDMAKELIKGHTISMMRSTFLCSAGLNPNLPGWFLLKEHSAGPLLDQAIHFIDVERYILGDISRLQTFSNNLVLPKSSKVTIEDSHSVNLCFTSGVIGKPFAFMDT